MIVKEVRTGYKIEAGQDKCGLVRIQKVVRFDNLPDLFTALTPLLFGKSEPYILF